MIRVGVMRKPLPRLHIFMNFKYSVFDGLYERARLQKCDRDF